MTALLLSFCQSYILHGTLFFFFFFFFLFFDTGRLGLTEIDHTNALRNMKMTVAEFTSMCASGEEKPDDTCKICFVNPINSVILPCGHFSICVHCGQRLQAKDASPKCPICRISITKIQQIFRA